MKAEALFDFEAENNNELDFKAGAIIRNVTRIDENWLEGTFGGKTGYFPTAYVKVVSGYLWGLAAWPLVSGHRREVELEANLTKLQNLKDN